MSDDIPVVWLENGSPRDDALRALGEWARARGVRLATADEPPPPSPLDTSIGDRVETELERGRLALGAADADATERALARAEAILREHPEFPQAAWLRAEVERAWSARFLRLEPRDDARARTRWENAQALDGGRIAGIGERAFPPRTAARHTLVLGGGAAARAALRLDGATLEPSSTSGPDAEYRLELAPGEHHVIALADDRIVFASWISFAGDDTITRIDALGGSPCSRARLFGSARHEEGRVVAAHVTCPTWIAAVPGAPRGSVLVAQCARDTCGPLVEWHVERPPMQRAPENHGKRSGFPGWVTWTIVGIGAATATSLALVATGVFDARPVEPRFVLGGARHE